jgi:hypothetical protein
MITKEKKVNEVFQTTNYGRFKFRSDNRIVNSGHVNKLVHSMKTNGWVKGSFVVVNEKGDLIDGQHRLIAAKTVGIPIQYIVVKQADFDTIQTLNQNQKNWMKSDHINGWVNKGVQDYIVLDEFQKKYPQFRITEHLMFLSNSFTSITKETFENGEFKVKNLKKAEEMADNIAKLKPYFDKYYNKSIFVRAMVKIMTRKSDFVFDEFLHKVSIRPGSIHPCGTVEQYVEMVENIYNYKRKNKVNLRF